MTNKTKAKFLNEIDRLSNKIAELEKYKTERLSAEQAGKQAEEKLKATNQQLISSEQQLRASNQQLTASEQQLRAANQQLIAHGKELRESEYQLKETQEIAGLGSYVLDISSGIWKSSSILDNIFGLDKKYKKDISGWLQIVHPEDKTMMQDYFATNVLINHEPFDKEYRIKRINGQKERWVHGMGRLESNDAGDPIKMIGTIQDITERKQAEEKQRKSDELNRSITQTATDAIISINSVGYILSWNSAAENIFGYSSTEMINKKLTKIMPTRHKIGHSTGMKRLKNGGKEKIIGKTTEITAVRKNGTEFPIELSLSSWEINNQKYYTGIIRDITERRRMEKKLISRNKELETWAEVTTGRELKMLELKKEINELLEKSGKKSKYKIPI